MAARRRFSTTRAAGTVLVDTSAFDAIGALLAALPMAIRNAIVVPIVRDIVNRGAKLAKQNLVRVLPDRTGQKKRWDRPTGALRDSLGVKVMPTSKMRNKNIVYGIWGARLDFRVRISTRLNLARVRRHLPQQGKFVGRAIRGVAQPGLVIPAKYIHLVERGHRAVVAWATDTQRRFNFPAARPYPFMAPTRATIEPQIPGLIQAGVRRQFPLVIARETRRAMTKINRATQGVS